MDVLVWQKFNLARKHWAFAPAVGKLASTMSSAVRDLQKAILERKQSLTQLLLQTKLIAAKLNLADVLKWCDDQPLAVLTGMS
jgi:hypothetical protein